MCARICMCKRGYALVKVATIDICGDAIALCVKYRLMFSVSLSLSESHTCILKGEFIMAITGSL